MKKIAALLLVVLIVLAALVILLPKQKDKVTTDPIVKQPTDQLDQSLDYYARLTTTVGEIEIDLFEKNAPNTVNNFIYLATIDFYKDTYFHRLIPDVLIQGGSPNTLNDNLGDDQFGGPGYVFKDEINWDSLELDSATRKELTADGFISNQDVTSRDIGKYRLAMANNGTQGTNGSQFFIILGDAEAAEIQAMRGRHTVFGEVVGGKNIVDSMSNLKLDGQISNNSRPKENIYIEKVEIFVK